MRYIARVGRWAYLLDARGQLYHVPLIAGQVAYPIDPDLAADSCRRHAAEEAAARNFAKAAALCRAAVALDALTDLPTAA
jgi:hypothetical protein